MQEILEEVFPPRGLPSVVRGHMGKNHHDGMWLDMGFFFLTLQASGPNFLWRRGGKTLARVRASYGLGVGESFLKGTRV